MQYVRAKNNNLSCNQKGCQNRKNIVKRLKVATKKKVWLKRKTEYIRPAGCCKSCTLCSFEIALKVVYKDIIEIHRWVVACCLHVTFTKNSSEFLLYTLVFSILCTTNDGSYVEALFEKKFALFDEHFGWRKTVSIRAAAGKKKCMNSYEMQMDR